MLPQKTLSTLDSCADRIRSEPHWRVIPSSFDPNDPELLAFPLPLDPAWPSGARALTYFDSRIVMSRLPLFWQNIGSIYAACHEARCTLYVNDAGNVPLASAAIQLIDVDTIITTPSDAITLCDQVTAALSPEVRWILVGQLTDSWEALDATLSRSRVAREIHVLPGVPLLEQCPNAIQEPQTRFHMSPFFSINTALTHVTGPADWIVPLRDLELPCRLDTPGVCACGKDTFAIPL